MKTKIVFAGVMGAILMSVGANAATTSVATKGYVDQLVGNTVTSMDAKYVTMKQVADAIGAGLADGKIDLSRYQLTANMVTETLADVAEADQNTKYPSVGAVLAAIEAKFSALDLKPEQIEQLKDLIKSDGVTSQISTLQSEVNTLKSSVETLTGDKSVDGSVAKSIVDAISAHKTEADGKYQAQSTAAYSFGTADGGWESLSGTQLNALNSGIDAEKVTAYDATKSTVDELTKEDGTIKNLQTVVGNETSGLVADVKANSDAIAENAAAIAENAEDIATNAAAIANKITMPAACASGNQTCVLMSSNGNVAWTPVTSPVEDPVTGGTTGEAIGG
ncbi:MAG: hypothetical protein ACI4NZ_03710 [Candidatus Enterousia sp.]